MSQHVRPFDSLVNRSALAKKCPVKPRRGLGPLAVGLWLIALGIERRDAQMLGNDIQLEVDLTLVRQ